MLSPRRARYSQAARSREAQASSAGAGASRPVGRLERTSFFYHLADAFAAHLHAGLVGKDGGECLTTPRGMAGAVRERVVVDETIEVVCQGPRHLWRSTGARAIHQPLGALVGKAIAPFPPGGVRTLERVGAGVEAVPLDDCAYGLGTPAPPGLLGLLQERV
jgi:hypothetical protein